MEFLQKKKKKDEHTAGKRAEQSIGGKRILDDSLEKREYNFS